MNIFASSHLRSRKIAGFVVCLLATVAAACAQSLLITTVAGYAGKGSADGSGSGALFLNPQGVAVDASGNTYVADTGNNTIRKITGGVSSTLAGLAGVSGSADGLGALARFNQPVGIAVDNANNIYVSDFGSSTIRRITPLGQVTTIAGRAGVTGSVNAIGTNALFFQPMGLALDAATNLYVADYGNHLIRKITPSFVVSTLAGQAGVFGSANATGTNAQFYEPEALTVDAATNVYVADTGNAAIRKITPGGAVTTPVGSPGSLGSTDGSGAGALFYQPAGIGIDSANNLYVSDAFNNTLRQVSPAGVVITIAGLAGTTGSADGANSSARFWSPQGVAVDSGGTIYVADTANGSIRLVTSGGVVTTLAGSASDGSVNGATSLARFFNPENLAVDNSSNVYVADTANSVIRKITPAGVVSVLAGTVGVFGSADGAGGSALFAGPQGVAVDHSGNLYVADTGNDTIRKITSGGTVSTLAGLAGFPGNADGSGTNAHFSQPQGVAVDGNGTVYVADTYNHTIRKVTSGGVVTTLAGLAGTYGIFDGTNTSARFNCPVGITVDASSNIYVADYNNHTIRKVTQAGVVTTIAGWAGVWGSADGLNNAALFFAPAGIDADSSGNLFVTDSGNSAIRKITFSGGNAVVTTVAGSPGVAGSSDGTGGGAQFFSPQGIALDPANNVYIADTDNNTIRSQGIVPLIITQPQSQSILAGATATFSVLAYGSSPFTYTWQYNGTNFAPSASGSIIVSNAGTYLVTVSNVAGSVISSNAILTVTNLPQGAAGIFQGISMQPNGAARLSFTGTSGAPYTLDFSTNLMTWIPLVSFSMTNGAVQLDDATATNSPVRFYRLTSP